MNLYLDASAIVKLLLDEEGYQQVQEVVAQATGIATSVVSYAEVRSALARKEREAAFEPGEYRRILDALERDWDRYTVLHLTLFIVRSAGELTEHRGLRALDALHLASALLVQSTGDTPLLFLSSDRRLQAAAQAEGLETITFV